MPCYLFTYHGHATWMPDHPRGYVHRRYGLQPSDPHMAEHYRFKQKSEAALFDEAAQRVLIEVARDAGAHIDAIVHGVAVEPTHVHVLMSWRHERAWKSVRASVRSALSRALNQRIGRRDPEGWFSDSSSRKRVRDQEHFDYLLLEYLPEHRWALDSRRGSARRGSARCAPNAIGPRPTSAPTLRRALAIDSHSLAGPLRGPRSPSGRALIVAQGGVAARLLAIDYWVEDRGASEKGGWRRLWPRHPANQLRLP